MKIRQGKISPPRIEMLPLIDVVFLLLVFFIFAMLSMAVHNGLPVDLPVSSAVTKSLEKTIAITIQADSGKTRLFVDKEPTVLKQLGKVLQRKKRAEFNGQDCEIQIMADKSVSYQQLFMVLDRIKSAGFGRISLQAEKGANAP